jgi:hypothetical protein
VIKREVLDNFYMIGGAAIGIAFIQVSARVFVLYIRQFTNVRRRRQDDGHQYNGINPIAQKK